ncbi:MAG: hypothetical protein BGO82_09105 [Devosia sp. 67-54]|uniref:Gfo/Idh/MocA family protein n=1 Tax=unclassified Devosia TaxID=196773 RepID=UPI0009626C2F|nr:MULTISPECIES: Gfo/Idh/MocA family oxidoreductase [unclassified Devosia]MBN9305214.1 Gfo/Idh/MocA family oxidoreductase [Devosia sp.]OJX14868.1 MAG: hypothetical protein BGO82_09105 [Devosia sp. 67-54]
MSTRIGLIGLDSSHADDFIRHLNREGRHPDLRITALQGGREARMAELQALDRDLVVCPTVENLLGKVDAVIVGHRDGALHRDAAIACLAASRPVFVDKPLANTRSDAEAIVDAAGRAGVALLSGSALRWQAETRRIKARLAGVDGATELHAWGTWHPHSDYGGAIFYAIHTVELAQELLGPHFRKVKRCRTGDPAIAYRCGDTAVTLSFQPPGASGHAEFGVEISGRGVAFRRPIVLGDDYMLPVVDRIAIMLRTGVSPMSREELIAPLALMEEIDALLRAT